MNILRKYEEKAKNNPPINIGIGFGDSTFHNHKIIAAVLEFLKKFNSTISFYGKVENLQKISQNITESRLRFIECQDPERSIIESLKQNSIQALIRGSLSSNKFLKNLKKTLKMDVINRLAILETVKEDQFFYGPVGIDECNNIENKVNFIENALKEFQKIEIVPKISILSGGRLGDIGRDAKINQSIQEAIKTVEFFKNKNPELIISHNEILIEEAIEKKSSFIIAPDGMSGNLIYRTLVHLGGGKAYGAIYMGVKRPIIDTSRVGDYSEYYGALILALALSK
jgi:putative methanogen marker protein 4